MGKAPDVPPTPDYAAAATAQGAANVDTARVQGRMNNPNTIGPTGSQTVTWDGDQPTIHQSLTPDAQTALANQQKTQAGLAGLAEQGIGTVRSAIAQPFNPHLAGLQTDLHDVGQTPVNQGMTGQDAIMARLAPQQTMEDNATRQRLANQGLTPGGEAYDNEMRIQNQAHTDQKLQATTQGLGLDAIAQNQRFNQEQQRAQFGNTAQQQALAQQTQIRNQPLNEVGGLMSGSQIQMPQFQGYNGVNVAPPPVFQGAQAQGQAALQNYGIAQSGANAMTAGLFGLMGSGAKIGASFI